MRGRKPIPSTLRLLQGNRSHRPLPPDEPKPPAIIPKCPTWLDKEAKKEWRRMVKELEPLGMLTLIDRSVLARYCDNFSKWMAAEKALQKMPMVKFNQKGFAEINPYFKVANKAKEMMMKDMIEMGMTPSSRSRVKAEPKPKEKGNAKERFFN
jgi:P27 family predicted phage terminase small subunit